MISPDFILGICLGFALGVSFVLIADALFGSRRN